MQKSWEQDLQDGFIGNDTVLQICNLSSAPGTHVKAEGENWPHDVVLWAPHMVHTTNGDAKNWKQSLRYFTTAFVNSHAHNS